jgi:hypothetical protein
VGKHGLFQDKSKKAEVLAPGYLTIAANVDITGNSELIRFLEI